MLKARFVTIMFLLLAALCFSATGVRAADILFVTAEDDPIDAEDTVIISFLEGLGYNVILIDDDEDEQSTEEAALAADLVFISESVNSGAIRTEITEIETPMIITEAWGWDEMGLTSGDGGGVAVASTNINIVNPGHFLAAGLSGTVPVLTTTGSARFALGVAGSQATVIARATLSDGQTYDVLYVYEKGAALPVAPADGSAQVAAEMRICFGFDELSYSVWNDNAYALLAAAVKYALGLTNQARSPKPSDGQEYVPRQTILSWTPTEDAWKYNLYFGTTFEDVNAADTDSPLLVDPGLDANSYDPGMLEFGRTYFWRVDEVGAPPESEVYKGNIWSFKIEPFAYPVSGEDITATASSYAENQEPENTINGSGLVDDLHSSETTEMWITAEGDAGPPWIQYEFDKVYKLDQMIVWNYNGQSYLAALGINAVTIEYSADGINWTQLDGTFTFPKAPGTNGYASDITVDFNDTPVKLVKINPVSNWLPAFPQYGLSEVRFLYVPVLAGQPDPAVESEDVAIDVTLGWRAGRKAAEHDVYISNDRQAVVDGTAPFITVTDTVYGPLSLDLGSTYYWRVDEVNGTDIWQGDLWNFTTHEYLVVEDFESYNDIIAGQAGSNLVYATWIDGYDNPTTNGSTMGYVTGSSLETDIIHGGGQSVPLIYDNGTASFSEVTVSMSELPIGRDWTVGSPAVLTLWFYGDPNNAVTERMYVKLNGVKKIYDGDAGDIATPSWTQWDIELASFGINLGNVTTLTIGFERTGATGGTGMVLIDDVCLYSPKQEDD